MEPGIFFGTISQAAEDAGKTIRQGAFSDSGPKTTLLSGILKKQIISKGFCSR
jgi:hypothetical protein